MKGLERLQIYLEDVYFTSDSPAWHSEEGIVQPRDKLLAAAESVELNGEYGELCELAWRKEHGDKILLKKIPRWGYKYTPGWEGGPRLDNALVAWGRTLVGKMFLVGMTVIAVVVWYVCRILIGMTTERA